jgi:plasmid maintenance system antidote protein VapI
MKLNAYIKLKGVTITGAAKAIGVSRPYLHDILSGRKEAGRKLVDKIALWSDGAVTYRDLWANTPKG